MDVTRLKPWRQSTDALKQSLLESHHSWIRTGNLTVANIAIENGRFTVALSIGDGDFP